MTIAPQSQSQSPYTDDILLSNKLIMLHLVEGIQCLTRLASELVQASNADKDKSDRNVTNKRGNLNSKEGGWNPAFLEFAVKPSSWRNFVDLSPEIPCNERFQKNLIICGHYRHVMHLVRAATARRGGGGDCWSPAPDTAALLMLMERWKELNAGLRVAHTKAVSNASNAGAQSRIGREHGFCLQLPETSVDVETTQLRLPHVCIYMDERDRLVVVRAFTLFKFDPNGSSAASDACRHRSPANAMSHSDKAAFVSRENAIILVVTPEGTVGLNKNNGDIGFRGRAPRASNLPYP